jgi:competence protein ComEC
VMVPLSGVLLGAGWALSLLGPLSPAFESFFATLSSWGCGVFLRLAEWFAGFPAASIHVERFPWWTIALYYAILFSGPHMRMSRSPGAREVRRSRFVLRLAALAALLAWWPVAADVPFLADAPPGRFRLTMLDVGQGDCLVLKFPDERVMMIDTGPESAARTIRDYLRAEGIDEIAALVLTHGHADHTGCVAEVIDAVHVGQIFEGASGPEANVRQRIEDAIEHRHVPVARIGRGEKLRGSDSMRLDVLSPDLEHPVSTSSNNQSVVLVAEYGSTRFLLMGDAEMAVESDLAATYGERLRSTVLKVGHHGSETSTSGRFAGVVKPRLALVSVGARNVYRHPSPRVVERLEQLGAKVLRTDESGSVEVASDGRRLWVRTPRRK